MDFEILEMENILDVLFAQTCRLHYVASTHTLKDIGLHRGQPQLLALLSLEDGKTHSQLADELDVTPATISNSVKRLEKGGFVIRQRDTEDERVSRVYLTKAGHVIRDAMFEKVKQMNERSFAGFSESEIMQLRDFLQRIQANLRTMVD